ncbi:MAG: quinolinate synthase NadA [Oscillospiraceae bacterium]|nr:quinolinate synthase NadA [Oscillospiraceae bacterium]
MTTREIQDEIIRLKKEKNICVLAHAYMTRDICEVADFVGDSFGLSEQAAKGDAETVIMCGVRFMAETCKLLSPQKKVILSSPIAGCPMAEQIEKDELIALKETYPGYTTVCYINTTTDLKTECDVCVTSSSAVKIIKNIDNDKILFVPDCNLGDFVKSQIPEKQFAFVRGGCPTHLRISVKDVEAAKAAHPDALILMHPECHPRVAALADFLGSTTGIMAYAEKSEHKEFLIGTENSIIQHLQFACPDKSFYPVSKDCVCHNMRATTLVDVLNCVNGTSGEEITLSEETMAKARRCIDEMLRLG